MEKFKTLKDHVYDYIARLIREGRLLPDQHINENVICQELNISRTPVREALIQLAAEDVLENRARKGFAIKSLSEKDTRELYAVIGVLDGFAAKLACDELTEKDYKDMEFYIASMDLAIEAANYEMYHKQQNSFHQLYIDKCGNSALIDTLSRAKNKLLKETYTDHDEEEIKQVFLSTNEEHRELLRMFREKDKEGLAVYIAETHWRSTYASYDTLI